jgi:hypothetical protein
MASRGQLKCDGTRAETKFRLPAKRTSLFKSAGASVQSNTGSRSVRISGSNVGYNMFRGSVKGTGYLLLSPVSPSLPLPCVTVCHHISTGVYLRYRWGRWRPGVEGSCKYFEHETSPLALTNHTCTCQINHTQHHFFTV